MKARTLTRFNDLKENIIREIGDVFEVTAKRVEQINSTHCGTLVEVIEEAKKETEPKKSTTKKPIKK